MDRYRQDPLASGARVRRALPEVAAERDLVVEEVSTGFVGAVLACEKAGGQFVVRLEDRTGRVRAFPLGPGFLIDGAPVTLVRPVVAPPRPVGALPEGRTASGSIAVAGTRARVARSSRIFVEGKHDAQLVEKVWGDDLRVEGVVVEILEGVDDLEAVIREFAPGPGRRMGVLVDHLVPGSKESRIAAAASALSPDVLVVGHPYVDVWQSVRPDRLGMTAWPLIERGTSWKHGICAHLGWPHESQADIAQAWQRILGTVHSYTDLQPELLGRVEELIDFVTDPQP